MANDEEFENYPDIDVSGQSDAPSAGRGSGTGKKDGKKKNSAKLEAFDWVQCAVGAIVFGIFMFIFFLRVVYVDGGSMLPTLQNYDQLVTSNLFYTPKDGDVVVVRSMSYGDSPLVKRVIATGGQTVDIDFDSGVVYVDGVALEEPYTNSPTTAREDFSGPVTVPEGKLFVMGDNRNASKDSRNDDVGMVDERCVIGKVLGILIPSDLPDEGRPRDWSRIGSIYN